ncbi:phosphoribosylglycinamide formyltransferase [Elizabethkingia argentiflava]|uniref:Phosphoribosylglycinamide formyltransferase n=1 Tax=Elizabethkingia argenteiflava TaxID=2681556 RepID=A0A845PV71_9FLAO|nr:phosphoribosylglycinamide formyltransferase [Elizabethkingia argenteiflava]NAW51555.1 phosphoribosylglycinamide formyltransferase [Elizabethkingia argenteiflava]
MKKKIVVLISGSGSNLQRIIEAISNQEIQNAEISMVIADRECYGAKRAESAGIPFHKIKRGTDFCSQLEACLPPDTALIVLAGFLSLLSSDFCYNWRGKIINIHPSLLPKFGGKGMWGMHVHEAVKAAGDLETGATVHFVTPEVDAGEIILQGKVVVQPSDTPEDIAHKVHGVEYEIFPKAIEKLLKGWKE